MKRYLGIIVAVILLGYVSGGMSRAACLENAVFWFSHVIASSQPYYVDFQEGQADVEQALNKVKAPYMPLTQEAAENSEMLPVVRIHTQAYLPFFISVRFDTTKDGINKAQFIAHYIGLFGTALSVGDSFGVGL